MTNKLKIALAAALIAAVTAPAIAQAKDLTRHGRLIERRNSAVITVPGVPGYFNPDSPAATGGGSTGYNALVQTF
jgi:hypothetical protein